MPIRCLSLLVLTLLLGAAWAAVVRPFETDAWATPENAVDLAVQATLKPHGARLRNPCSDEVFLRRVYLDTIDRGHRRDDRRVRVPGDDLRRLGRLSEGDIRVL